MSTPPPTSVSLPPDLRVEIRERARVERRSFSSQVIVLLQAAVAEPGASVAYLARILGHGNPSITMAVSAHEFASREPGEAMRERRESAFGDVLR